ncbi:MAG: flagellar protein FlaG [Clostridiales bacterium]|nr:flagellar protein FlaG [Roseburia sp.]MDD7636966.1 flagellar protein FlaG [Clostridiales bacterium]MDY4112974.1 flagellar protein FlaG [Roseburia sp.]
MGIEKISGNGAVSYQGSATVSASSAASSVEPVTQTSGTEAPVTGTMVQDFSLNAGAEEDRNRSEEMATMNNTQLKNAVGDLNKQLKNSEAIFGIHDKTNRVTIKIVDKTTKEVIKEYPPEQTLDMIAKVWEIAGILVDEKR